MYIQYRFALLSKKSILCDFEPAKAQDIEHGDMWDTMDSVTNVTNMFRIALFAGCVYFLTVPAAQAETLAENLRLLATEHKRAIASNADVSAAEQRVDVAKGGWYPTFDTTANYGFEDRDKPSGTADTRIVPRNFDLSLTQKLWDFGSTDANIKRSRITLEQSQATRDATLQGLIVEGISAHLNVIRAFKVLEFSKGSTANIKRQTELEDARVQRGAGFSTDVLQAKTQLAGAQALEIQSQGVLKQALNRYRAVFGFLPDDPSALISPRLPLEMLPNSLDETVSLTFKHNPQLLASRLSADIALEDVNISRADGFFPVFEASAESNHKKDNGGTTGSQHERLVKVEATFSFNMGATAVNTLKASEQSHLATTNRYGETRDNLEEQARNAWDGLETARSNAEHLHNQANIAAEFLELARRERQLGNRSLIDVLAGETALISASSDAASADTNVALAVFTLLNVIGAITPEIVN